MIFRRTTSQITEPAVSPEATCREVIRVMQLYLDGRVDEVTAARVARHLEACRDCGLETATYEAIRAALARRRPIADEAALQRLRTFGESLAAAGPGGPPGPGGQPGPRGHIPPDDITGRNPA